MSSLGFSHMSMSVLSASALESEAKEGAAEAGAAMPPPLTTEGKQVEWMGHISAPNSRPSVPLTHSTAPHHPSSPALPLATAADASSAMVLASPTPPLSAFDSPSPMPGASSLSLSLGPPSVSHQASLGLSDPALAALPAWQVGRQRCVEVFLG